jgi:hypothetical protein
MKFMIFIFMAILLGCVAYANEFENLTVMGEEAAGNSAVSSFWGNIANIGQGFVSFITENPFVNAIWQATGADIAKNVGISVDKAVATAQKDNAKGKTQLVTEEQIHDLNKSSITGLTGEAWALVIGLLLLVKDTLILLMLYFEMRIFLFVFVQLIPNIFIKARDSVANSIYKGRT